MTANIFDIPEPLPDEEVFNDLIPPKDVKIERIISNGQKHRLGSGTTKIFMSGWF